MRIVFVLSSSRVQHACLRSRAAAVCRAWSDPAVLHLTPNFVIYLAPHISTCADHQGICDAKYRILAWTMNGPGSQNDRTAFIFSGFGKLLQPLPPGYFILGDAAYPSSDRVVVPYPGKGLPVNQDAFNYYQSQCRMAIEQTFGILVGGLQRVCTGDDWCGSTLALSF